MTLSWTNPPESNLTTIRVLRKEGSYPTGKLDGTIFYNLNPSTPSAPIVVTDVGLTNGVTYYYSVYSRNTVGVWNVTTTPGLNADTGTPSAGP